MGVGTRARLREESGALWRAVGGLARKLPGPSLDSCTGVANDSLRRHPWHSPTHPCGTLGAPLQLPLPMYLPFILLLFLIISIGKPSISYSNKNE